MSDSLTVPKRRRGGQPGNTNALKHGFYTRRFDQTDLADVQSTDYNGLMEEISIIRLYSRRLIELDNQSSGIDQVANILRMLCLASLTITRLVKTSRYLQLNGDAGKSELDRANEHLTNVLHLDQLELPPEIVYHPHLLPPR